MCFKKLKLFMAIMAGFFIMSISSISSFAWEKGHVKIEPSFGVGEVWDSNIFYDPNDEENDFITLLTPGVMGQFAFGQNGRHKTSIDYDAEVGIFGKFDSQNYGNHSVTNALALDLGDYSLDLSNNFKSTSSRSGTEFERRNLRKEDTASAVLGFHYNKIDFDLAYNFFIVDFNSDTLKEFNRYENGVSLAGYVDIMTKTKGLLEFGYKNIQYPDVGARNGNAYRGMAGVTGDLTAKLTGTIKAGYELKRYESSPRDDSTNAVANVGLDYDFNEQTELQLSYQREAYESTFSNNNFYAGDHFDTVLSYAWKPNIIAKVDGMYYHNAYPEPGVGNGKKRTDNEWAIGTGVDYKWKEWLTASAWYRFHQRESNVDNREYDQHVIGTNIAVVF